MGVGYSCTNKHSKRISRPITHAMKRSDIISQYVRINRQFEVLYAPKVRKAIHAMTLQTMKDLEQGYQHAIGNLTSTIGNEKMTPVIQSLYVEVGLRHARLTHRRLVADQKKGLGFNSIWTAFVNNYLKRFLLDKITFEIAATTRKALLRALQIGVTSGLGVDGMIKILKDWPYERSQAARIVRTEVNRAANVGAKAQESTSEYEQQKEWISVKDNRTRGQKKGDHANHVKLNGVRVDAGDEFVDPINGDRLDIPGDPKASAASTINCRCQAAFVNKRDDKGELVPKRKTTTVVYPGQGSRGPMITI